MRNNKGDVYLTLRCMVRSRNKNVSVGLTLEPFRVSPRETNSFGLRTKELVNEPLFSDFSLKESNQGSRDNEMEPVGMKYLRKLRLQGLASTGDKSAIILLVDRNLLTHLKIVY